MIEQYYTEANGYHPFLISKGWQVALLNYLPEQDVNAIVKVDRHLETDEAFVLIKGTAVLIEAVPGPDEFEFICLKMVAGVIYNVPAGMWHNIAMDSQAQVIIAEKNDTHLHDFEFAYLGDNAKQRLRNNILTCIADYEKK